MSFDQLIHILEVVLGVGALIFVHELGHFLVAKRIGVKVEAFSLGFGKYVGFKRGETEYRLSMIPLGGYVKMASEQRGPETTGAPDEFTSKPPGQRAAVLAAGVSMNAVFAVLCFAVAFRLGVPFMPAEVGGMDVGSPAWEAGLEPGDVITRIDGETINDFEDLSTAVALTNSATDLMVEVQRGSERFEVPVRPKYDAEQGFLRIGIIPPVTMEVEEIMAFDGPSPASALSKLRGKGKSETKLRCPAQEAGIQIGDKVLAVNGQPVTQWSQLREIIGRHPDVEIPITVERKGERLDLKVTPMPSVRWMIGISGRSNAAEAVRRTGLAGKAGLRADDEIVGIGEQEVRTWAEIDKALASAADGPVALKVRRAGQIKNLTIPLTEGAKATDALAEVLPRQSLTIDTLVKDFPAQQLGLKPGDRIVGLDGEKMRDWDHLLDKVTNSNGKLMQIEWERGGETFIGEIRPIKDEKSAVGQIGIGPRRKMIVRQYGVAMSCVMGFQKAVVNVQRVYLMIRSFFTRKLSTKTVGGIILIAQASYHSAKQGLSTLLYFLGIIGANLAVINVLPIPVLDGGHLMLLGIEKLKGKPLSERAQAVANYVGLFLVLGLVLYATRNDILRLMKGF
ncbi:MAG: RIP metalloprotease RseP [Planctomycetes bacterium]|nr:RIP metalloprotease RseP [Planctomycetota bacterium]